MGPFLEDWDPNTFTFWNRIHRMQFLYLQYVYSFTVSLKDFHIRWVVYYIQQTTKKSLTLIQGKQIMSLLCTAQTVWNKGLKKHWFPIVATYGTCIMGRWTCLWSGTCNIIIILHHKVTNDLMNYPRWGQLIDFQWQAMGMPICCIYAYLRGKHLFEGVAYFIF